MIKDILDSNAEGIYLFTRPRRFGKTTNLSMLDAFFNMKYKGNTWFDDFEISKYSEYNQYKNAFPVMYIDLKNTVANDYGDFITRIRSILSLLFNDHKDLLKLDDIPDADVKLFRQAMDLEVDASRMEDCIPMLCKLLERYHGVKPIILIDEYDRAVSDAFGSDSHRPMMDLLGRIMSTALKSNEHLQMAVVTGVMQIAKESIFSGLNNLRVNNIFSELSDERYGFTEAEVKQILSDYGNPEKFKEAKQWYDGYRFGNAEVYNPFSVMNYVSSKFKAKPYWINSGGDSVVRWLLQRTDKDTFEDLVSLISGKTIRTFLTEALTYGDVRDDDRPLYSLMAMTGYIKAVPLGGERFEISMPNREVRSMLQKVSEKVTPINSKKFIDFCGAVLDEDERKVTSLLQEILLTGSYLNLTDETSYELVLATLLIPLADSYEIRTEREEGNGRVGIILTPKRDKLIPMIFELKTAGSEPELDRFLDSAFDQIHDRKYYLGMKGRILLAGFAFHGKIPKVRIGIIDNGDGFSNVQL